MLVPEPVSLHSMQPSNGLIVSHICCGACVRDSHPQPCTGATRQSSACQLLFKSCAHLFSALYRKREREEEPLPPSRGAKQPRINVMGQVEGEHLLAACGEHAETLLRAAGDLLCVTWQPSFMLSVPHWC